MEVSQLEYLFILFEDRRLNLGMEADAMENIIKDKNRNVLKDLTKDRLLISNKKKSVH